VIGFLAHRLTEHAITSLGVGLCRREPRHSGFSMVGATSFNGVFEYIPSGTIGSLAILDRLDIKYSLQALYNPLIQRLGYDYVDTDSADTTLLRTRAIHQAALAEDE
jgi:hypothetical protein